MNVLDWYGAYLEHVGADPVFACKSPLVELALWAQKVYNELHGGTAKPGGDPDMGLKDILPQSDKLLMMDYIYHKQNDWGPASINFTWGQNGAFVGPLIVS
jgi:hypothetical protein